MIIKKIPFFGFVFLLHFMVNGQSLDSVISLDNIEITLKKEKFLVGSKIETIDSIKLSSVSGASLTELLNRYLPIYVKQDAGGLSTIRFRGTSPDHTAILFDGININSLTLGHSNLSNIPVFLFNDIKVQFGSSSSLYGTDAIGGSIQLNDRLKWNNGLSFELQQDIASFGSYFTGLKFAYSNNRIKYSIKAFHQQIENDFPFLNTAVRDFEKDEYINDVQKNASIKNYGLLQEFNYKISDKLFFYTRQWYQDNWREIQPNMSENYYGADYKEIETRNLRITTGLKYYADIHKITANFGYLYDYQLYDNDYEQVISTNTFTSNINYYNSDLLNGIFNAGFNYSHLWSDVYAYNENVSEDRLDLFTSYKVNLLQKLTMVLNLRESIVMNYTNQFIPSIGFDYLFIETDKNSLKGIASVSKSYKIPTFNDRFWYPNGNPDILPESGMNYEIGTTYNLANARSTYGFGLTAFILDVDNWIQWAPVGDIWRPDNLAMVQSIGIEFSFDQTFLVSDFSLKWGLNYSLTNASMVDDFWTMDFSDREQLFYTPKHMANIFSSLDHKGWQLLASASYTGSRFTEGHETLDGYFLADLSFGKNLYFNKNIISVHLDINNLFDKAYQNQAYYAMPGRNFGIKINYLYN